MGCLAALRSECCGVTAFTGHGYTLARSAIASWGPGTTTTAGLAEQADLVGNGVQGTEVAVGAAHRECAFYRIDGHRGDSCGPGIVEAPVGEPAGQAGLPHAEEVSAGAADDLGVIGELDSDRRDGTAGHPSRGLEEITNLGDLGPDYGGRSGGVLSGPVDMVEDVTGHEIHDLRRDLFFATREVQVAGGQS
jgi:hypothetical protein